MHNTIFITSESSRTLTNPLVHTENIGGALSSKKLLTVEEFKQLGHLRLREIPRM